MTFKRVLNELTLFSLITKHLKSESLFYFRRFLVTFRRFFSHFLVALTIFGLIQ